MDLEGQERELLYPVETKSIKAVVSTMTIDGDELVDVLTYPELNSMNYVRKIPFLYHLEKCLSLSRMKSHC